MIFIETPIFTRLVTALGDDDSYRQLQQLLTRDPRAGDLIQGTGGLRKIRMAASGRGKRWWCEGHLLLLRIGIPNRNAVRLSEECSHRPQYRTKADSVQDRGNLEATTMNKKLFAELVQSMEQAGEIIRGERAPSRELNIDSVTIKKIRQAARLSQAKFAKVIDVQVTTLQNWEQGRRDPTGPAKALLRAISKDPKHVLAALA